MTIICNELKRVMKEGGNMWINIGDTFYGGGGATGQPYDWVSISTQNRDKYPLDGAVTLNKCGCGVCVSKQKIGIPFRLRFALNDIGLISRDDVIWRKKNHMPGSQRDRFTVSYEFLFRFVKNNSKKTWWYNQKKREWLTEEPNPNPISYWRLRRNGHKIAVKEWAGFDYYFDLDSIRKPHLTNEGRPGGLVRTRDFGYNSKYLNPDDYAKWYFEEREKKGFHDHGDDSQMGFGQQKRGHKMENLPHPYGKAPDDTMELDMKEEAERTGYSTHSASRLTTGLHVKHKAGIIVGHELGKTPSDIIDTTKTEAGNEKDFKGAGIHRRIGQAYQNALQSDPNYLGKTPDDVYDGKFAEESESFNSPRARQAREGYEPSFYHELGGNPGDILEINTRANTLSWCKTCQAMVHEPICPVCKSKTIGHYAGFPEELIKDPIIVSTPEGRCECEDCGHTWKI
jgi:DNA modification methylase